MMHINIRLPDFTILSWLAAIKILIEFLMGGLLRMNLTRIHKNRLFSRVNNML